MSSSKPFYADWLERYEGLVKKHPNDVRVAVESLSMLTFFIPGRFGDVELISEASYVVLNLLELYHGRILDASRALTAGPLWHWRSFLTVLQETGVVLEMMSLSRGGEKGRWKFIFTIESIKALVRLHLVLSGEASVGGARVLADGGRFSTPLRRPDGSQSPGDSPSRRQNRDVVDAHVRQWRRDRYNTSLEGLKRESTLSQGKYRLLLGESLHVFRPVAYVALRRKLGASSWIPWLVSGIIDIFSLRYSNDGVQKCKKMDLKVGTSDVNTSPRAEFQRRQMLLLMYFMREPFYSMLTGRVAKSVLGTFAKIPLVGFFFEYFLEMLEYMKRYYFFWSGS
jgi:peroxin-16